MPESRAKRVLVTGATGFVASHLIPVLEASGYCVIAQTRSGQAVAQEVVTSTDEVNFADLDCVAHMAGMAHAGVSGASLEQLSAVNVDQTLALYRKAMAARVPHFVWLSSSKVLGDASSEPLAVDAPYNPGDPYARSKVQAEEKLLQEGGGEALAIVRPPLIYGPGVKANFLALLKWGSSAWPLPLGRAHEPRAWLAVENLTSLLLRLMSYSGSETIWHVRDHEETSVANMLRRIRSLSNRRDHLIGIPPQWLRTVAGVMGRAEDAQRLLAPLRIDIERTIRHLDWQPPVTQASAVKEVVQWYRSPR